MGLYWTKTPTDAWMPKFIDWQFKLVEVVKSVFAARAEEITAWMKAEAVWKDRTGNARRSLNVQIIEEGFIVALVMAYTIPIFYSRYLETMQQGRFSILSPALDHWTPILLRDLKKALK